MEVLFVTTFASADFLLDSISAALDLSTAALASDSASSACSAVASAFSPAFVKDVACRFLDVSAADFSSSGK